MNKLTNWQRTKWARAGRPGLQKGHQRIYDIKELRKWQNLKHWKAILREQQSKEV